MTLTATGTAVGAPQRAAHGGLTVQWTTDHRRATSPAILAQRPRPHAAVRRALIYDQRPEARAALTVRVAAAVPSVSGITCAARPADLITTFAGRPADLVFIGVELRAAGGVGTADLFLRRYPTATVIVVGTINDIHPLTSAVAGGVAGLMLWDPWQENDPSRRRPVFITRPAPPRGPVPSADPGRPVTPAERGILQDMSRGLSNREIGAHLNLSEETVKAKARALYRKLGARDRAQAVALALRQQLLL